MKNQYKPTKLKTTKAPKPKKEKQTKVEKITNIGTAKAIKLNKPKKVKEPKPVKQPKVDKSTAFVPTKMEKAQKLEKAGRLQQPKNVKLLAAILGSVVVVLAAVLLLIFLRNAEEVVEPKELSILNMPNKTTYYVGESSDFFNLKLVMTMTNGGEITVNGSECEITGFDSSVPVDVQIITVKYKNLSTTFNVSIKEIPANPTGKYNNLTFKTLPKTEYKKGEWLDARGGVLIVHYDDGTTREMELKDDYVYGFRSDKLGPLELEVIYIENGVLCTTTYTITVTE
ncbi:MAG: bacterial Ig-like domain-containing protein [Clostridia bacterium]|nr:bacterial Ig-like domain-containing protein [Clostridia bacterium]